MSGGDQLRSRCLSFDYDELHALHAALSARKRALPPGTPRYRVAARLLDEVYRGLQEWHRPQS